MAPMQNKRRILTEELINTGFINVLFLILESLAVIKAPKGFLNGFLEETIKTMIRTGEHTKNEIIKLVNDNLDDAIDETIYKNEERWQEFGFDTEEVEDIVDEESIDDKIRAQVNSFMMNI